MISSEQLPRVAPLDPRTLRNVCGLFVTGVTVITSATPELAAATTVNSFTSVSLEPPLVLFCLHRQSRLREVLTQAGAFGVNFLAGRQERLARVFARRDTADLSDVEHYRTPAGVPILSRVLAYLACELIDEFEGGDHTIFLGKVTELGTPHSHHEPLIFFQGSLETLERRALGTHPIWDG